MEPPPDSERIIASKKLEQALELSDVLERHIERLSSEFFTQVVLSENDRDSGAVVQALRLGLIPLSKEGLHRELIEPDLKRIREALGPRHQQVVADAWANVSKRLDEVARCCRESETSNAAFHATQQAGEVILDLLKLGSVPVRQLVSELSEQVKSRAKTPTDKQRRTRIRNERIEQLARDLGTNSHAKIARAGGEDPIIKSVCPPEPFNIEIVRNVLKPRRSKPR